MTDAGPSAQSTTPARLSCDTQKVKRDPRLIRLSWDHHRGLVLARDIEKALASPDPDVAPVYSRLLAEWSAGLLPHFRGEQECLLARLLPTGSAASDAIGRTLLDHLAIESLVAFMRDTTDEAARASALAEFAARLKAHIRWEESELFPITESMLGDAGLTALAADLDATLPPFEDTVPGTV